MKPMDQKNWVAPSPSAPMPIHLLPRAVDIHKRQGAVLDKVMLRPAHDDPAPRLRGEPARPAGLGTALPQRHRLTKLLREYWGYLSQSFGFPSGPG